MFEDIENSVDPESQEHNTILEIKIPCTSFSCHSQVAIPVMQAIGGITTLVCVITLTPFPWPAIIGIGGVGLYLSGVATEFFIYNLKKIHELLQGSCENAFISCTFRSQPASWRSDCNLSTNSILCFNTFVLCQGFDGLQAVATRLLANSNNDNIEENLVSSDDEGPRP